jgi:shikimate 5-dehydrogenase
MKREFLFFGVSTGGSSILGVFPVWGEILGLNATITGKDIPMGAPAEAYRRSVEAVRANDAIIGALITSHKVAFHEHAADLFDELDDLAVSCGEISCITKHDGKLCGLAKDPVVAAQVLDALMPTEYWPSTGSNALCLGAGGAGTAISVALLRSDQPPRRVLVTDTQPNQLARLQEVHRRMGVEARVGYHTIGATADTDRLVEALPPGSLVINATGMGKDIPGSPISDSTAFPHDGIAWELNYRGELTFLEQAERQRLNGSLRVTNGWEYFIRAWVTVIEEVFSRTINEEIVKQLARAADGHRPAVAGGAPG